MKLTDRTLVALRGLARPACTVEIGAVLGVSTSILGWPVAMLQASGTIECVETRRFAGRERRFFLPKETTS